MYNEIQMLQDLQNYRLKLHMGKYKYSKILNKLGVNYINHNREEAFIIFSLAAAYGNMDAFCNALCYTAERHLQSI